MKRNIESPQPFWHGQCFWVLLLLLSSPGCYYYYYYYDVSPRVGSFIPAFVSYVFYFDTKLPSLPLSNAAIAFIFYLFPFILLYSKLAGVEVIFPPAHPPPPGATSHSGHVLMPVSSMNFLAMNDFCWSSTCSDARLFFSHICKRNDMFF